MIFLYKMLYLVQLCNKHLIGNLKAFNIIVDMLRTKLENSEMISNMSNGIYFINNIPEKLAELKKEKKEIDTKELKE